MNTRILLLGAVLLAAATPALAEDLSSPTLEKGFMADGSYQVLGLDTIDLFRGTLSLNIPLGQSYATTGGFSYRFMLTYHSDAWEIFSQDNCPTSNDPCYYYMALPNRRANAGAGWMLSFGELIDPDESDRFHPRWTYVSPDGGEHAFFASLHNGEDEDTQYSYTRDGSYMRMREEGPGWRRIEMTDGTAHYFEADEDVPYRWRLRSIHGRYGVSLTIDYDTDPATGHPRWEVTDNTGRTHHVEFDAAGGHIETIRLAAFNAQQAIYTFGHEVTAVHRVCWDNSGSPEWWNLALLTSVTLPDNSSYRMGDSSDPFYYTCCTAGPPSCTHDCTGAPTAGYMSPGVLYRLFAPTGGGIEWAFEDRIYTWESCYHDGQHYMVHPNSQWWATVKKRKLLDDTGTPVPGHTWEYSNQDNPHYPTETHPGRSDCGFRPEERRTVVTAPDGNSTVYYFRAYPAERYLYHKREYGLPFTRRVPDPSGGDRFLSSQVFAGAVHFNDGDNGDGSPVEVPLRSDYKSFKLDEASGTLENPGHREVNRHLGSERTVTLFNGTSEAEWAGVTYDSFDGLGHFRTATTSGSGGAADVRVTETNYNEALGTYPPTTPPDPPEPWFPTDSNWIINSYTQSKVVENGKVAWTQACFDETKGFLRATRVLGDDDNDATPDPADTDLLAVFTPDPATGNIVTEEYLGGDTQLGALPSNYCTPSATGNPWAALGSAQYRLEHRYAAGSRQKSWYSNAAGSAVVLPLVNNTYLSSGNEVSGIDPNTGLVAATRDPADITTYLTYDLMSRPILVQPEAGHGATAETSYTPFNASDPDTPRIEITSRSADGTKTYSRSTGVFDVFGRLVREQRLMPTVTESWSQRLIGYDAMGRKEWGSEWQPLGTSGPAVKKTVFSNFDPFGRIGLITSPDGSTLTRTYEGVRTQTRTVDVDGVPATTTESYDRQGRLVEVKEYSDPSSPNPVATTYGYDIGNRLTTVTMPGPQTRTFTYDNRGFLRFEDLPESTVPGGRTGECASHDLCYEHYDARGHFRHKENGAHKLLFTYDSAERLTKVEQADTNWVPLANPLRQFTFATANDGANRKAGKLESATASNPAVALGGATTVTETYTYAGIGGRVSARQTAIAVSGSSIGDFSEAFTEAFTWKEFGGLESVAYPACGSAACAAVTPQRTVYNEYRNGFLTAVGPYYATSLTYLDNGMIGQLTHGKREFGLSDGIADRVEIDAATAMARPHRIYTEGAIVPGTGNEGDWSSGTYSYDGAGNITGMAADVPLKPNSDEFHYDKVSRLTSASVSEGATSQAETYEYDVYGNMTEYNGLARAISGTSNRLSEGTYDPAGNLTVWPASIPVFTNTFDALNQMATRSVPLVSSSFAYSADGERVLVRDGNTFTLTLRDLSGRVLREMTRAGGTWQWKKDYVYRGGSLLASVDRDDGLRHYHLDHLGSPRMATNRCGERFRLYTTMPFGTEFALPQDDERMRFTVHERDLGDLESSNDDMDYMHARYYGPVLARLTSIDPVRGSAGRPQSFNLFAYVGNNPINAFDPLGLAGEKPDPTPPPPGTDDNKCTGADDPDCPQQPGPTPTPNPPRSEPANACVSGGALACILSILNGLMPPMFIDPSEPSAKDTVEKAQQVVDSLPDDALKALQEILGGKPRPNVRKPSVYQNDGREGSQVLPPRDAEGNPIHYTEHTVNPREPGKNLDGKRFVEGTDGRIYYTDDHYRTLHEVPRR
jgi:RHS repeat-associated protein